MQLTGEHFQNVRQIKEQMCHVSMDYNTDYYSRDDILDSEQRSYELPSGEIIEVGHQKRLKAAEVIFDPSILEDADSSTSGHKKNQGIAQIALAAID